MKKAAALLTLITLTACSQAAAPTTTGTVPSTPISNNTPSFDLAFVATHTTPSDCWMAIHDKVYNMTAFILDKKHPAGDIIVQGCGKDATALFENRPGEGDAHSQQARAMLPSFYIGELKK